MVASRPDIGALERINIKGNSKTVEAGFNRSEAVLRRFPKPILLIYLVFLTTTLTATFPATVSAQPKPGDDRDRLYTFPMASAPDVSQIIKSRIESFFNAVLNINDQLHLLQEEDLIIDIQPSRSLTDTTNKDLDLADKKLMSGKAQMDKNFPRRAIPHLKKAISLYEANFVDLIDYDKLVDAYLKLAQAQFAQEFVDESRESLATVVAMQPSVTLDRKKTPPEFIELLTSVRNAMAYFEPGTVRVTSGTPGVTVFVDGINRGRAPATIENLLRGKHFVQLRADGMKPYGKKITAPSKGGTVNVSGTLVVDENAALTEVEGEFISPEPLAPYAESGNFATNFYRAARHFCARAYVNHLLYGYVSRVSEGYTLHLFLYDASVGKMATITPVTVNESLGNLQMVLLDQEQALVNAIKSFPSRKILRTVPPIVYTEGEKKLMSGVTVESKRPVTTGSNDWSSGATTPTPTPTPTPVVVAPEKKDPVVVKQPVLTADPIFGDYPTVDDSLVTSTDNTNYDSSVGGNEWYEEWWVWTIVGVGVAGIGVGTAFGLGAFDGGSGGASFTGTVQLP